VSICREKDVPLAVVEAIVGHGNPTMTRLYTHVSETAACQAVSSLPVLIGKSNGQPPSLPDNPQIARFAKIRVIAEGMTIDTWEERRHEILQLTTAASQ
jgi:hypothetical protein